MFSLSRRRCTRGWGRPCGSSPRSSAQSSPISDLPPRDGPRGAAVPATGLSRASAHHEAGPSASEAGPSDPEPGGSEDV